MKVLLICTGIVSLLLADTASAACSGSKTLFFCNTQKGNKQIEVCDAGKTINYSFGQKGKTPELAISVPRSQVTTYQWEGFGRNIFYSVDIPNGDYVYKVFWSTDRLQEEPSIEAGVNIQKKNKLLAEVYCQEKGLISNLEGVDLKRAE